MLVLTSMDEVDREILNEIQWTFPLTERPYHAIAEKFGLSSDDVMNRLRQMKQSGVLRQLSAIFDTRRLGYKSSLVAMEIEPERLEHVASQINKHPGVSHNYERDHRFNLWFTLATPPGSDLKTELDKFSGLEGIKKVRMLPTIKLFKIGVKLDMVEGKKHEVRPSEEKKQTRHVRFEPSEEDKEFIRHLQKDLAIVEEPFLEYSKKLNMSVPAIFAKLRWYEEIGVLRRFAAILRHRDAGFTANGMIVWRVPEDDIEAVGQKLGAFPQVSHCYQRPTYDDWPYNVFSMIHCKSIDEADAVASQIEKQIDVHEYRILFSSREFKKTRVEYFVEQNFSLEDAISA